MGSFKPKERIGIGIGHTEYRMGIRKEKHKESTRGRGEKPEKRKSAAPPPSSCARRSNNESEQIDQLSFELATGAN